MCRGTWLVTDATLESQPVEREELLGLCLAQFNNAPVKPTLTRGRGPAGTVLFPHTIGPGRRKTRHGILRHFRRVGCLRLSVALSPLPGVLSGFSTFLSFYLSSGMYPTF